MPICQWRMGKIFAVSCGVLWGFAGQNVTVSGAAVKEEKVAVAFWK